MLVIPLNTMKAQAILVAIFHAQRALAYDVAETTGLINMPCASPCKKTSLRASASAMLQCLETNCGTTEIINFDTNDEVRQCVRRCKMLRFSRERQLGCIEDCHTGDSSLERAGDIYIDAKFDNEEKGEGDGNFEYGQCVASCRRKRWGARLMDQCIKECDEDYSPTEEPSLVEEENEYAGLSDEYKVE